MIKRNDVAKKESNSSACKMALRDNILTPEVKANGFGGVDMGRLDKSIDQIALTYDFKSRSRRATTFSTRRSCRRPPTARRTGAMPGGRGSRR